MLLHRPDRELKRLTARNKDELLFDDVLWVRRAARSTTPSRTRSPSATSIEQVKRFAILPRDFTQPDGELTPTLKIKRNVIVARYARIVEQLHAKPGP